jgi:alpha-2-macroglobulin
MKRKNLVYLIGGILIFAVILFVLIKLVSGSKEKTISDPHLFSSYISGYTSGVVSKHSSITIVLSSSFVNSFGDEKPTEGIFKISPTVKGETVWADDYTLQFIPEKPLESGETYIIECKLDKLKKDIGSEFESFLFQIFVKQQNFTVDYDELISTDFSEFMVYDLTGHIKLADAEPKEKVEKILNAKIDSKNLNIELEQITDREFCFRIKDIPRSDKQKTLKLEFDGEHIGVEKSGNIDYDIPESGVFKVLNAKVEHFPEQCVVIQFSNPVLESQYLEGLVRLEDDPELKYIIRNNIIKIIPTTRLQGKYNLYVNEGIKDLRQQQLLNRFFKNLNFEARKPELRTVHKGVIMPTTEDGLVFPFEAVNLKAVDIQITRIFENNVMQFLQNNSFDGTYEIRRVGKPVKQTTINLEQAGITDFGEWSRFTIDLNYLIEPEPGAIYAVDICFRQQHALYPCQANDSLFEAVGNLTNTLGSNDEDFWNYEFENYTYGDYYYDWEQAEDPCSEYYYGYKKSISANLFASDIGLLVKKGADNELMVVTTDLLTALPLKSCEIEIYNFQQQLIAKAKTDKNGIAIIEYDKNEEAFFVIAKNNSQKAYLKLDYGESQSYSEFDVSGNSSSDNQAFIFGERGVWRPGDSIFLSLIIEENIEPIPVGHPIVLEVTNPRGQLVYREVQGKNEWSYHTFRFKTENSDPTGNYNAKISIGGNSYWKTLPVETIKPNRLQIEMDFSKNYLSGDGDVTATLTSRWLHGAIAKGLKANVNVTLYEALTSFKDYEDYHFIDITKSLDFETKQLFEGTTDNNGQIIQAVKFNIGKTAPGKCYAVLSAKVFEKGGNFSTSEESIDFYPYSSFVGTKIPAKSDSYYLKGNKTYDLDIVILDNDGKKINNRRQLEVLLFEYEWSWWYESDDVNASFASSNYNNAIDKKTVTIEAGKGKTSFDIPNVDYGDFLLYVYDPVSGHSSAQIINVSRYSYGSYSYDGAKGAQMLTLEPENDTVKLGEDIIVKLPEGEGRALVTIENGSRILHSEWIEVKGKNSEFKIKASAEMSPNIYVNVNFIQAHSQTENDHPIRMYGVIPVWVENPATHLKPVIDMPDELEAESKVKIKISEENSQAMTYTIAIVDEGLLNLTRHSTPNPWSYFYSRDALGVNTWDMFDWVIGAYGIKLERLLSIGGGAGLDGDLDPLKANRFEPMVRFMGPYHLDKNKSATHEIELPQYIGSVRTMVVASNNETMAYGSTEKKTPVTKPLMVLGSLPRLLSPQEEVMLPITLFAMHPSVKNALVEIKTNELISIDGPSKQTVQFDKEGEQYVSFKLNVNNATGVAKVEISAKSGIYKANYDIELNVRYPNPPSTDVLTALADGGKSTSLEFDALGIPGTNNTVLELYSIPPVNLQKRLEYLISYPHGCVEQIISAAFPQLYVSDFVKLSDKEAENIQKHVNTTINKLTKYQLKNGGFSYWPGNDNVSTWGTNYAGHFLVEAQKSGYNVPNTVINNWVAYQKSKASKWTDDGSYSQLTQAYRLYTLALSGNPDKGAMNRFRQISNLSVQSQWRIAAAYQLTGNQRVAEQMINGLTSKIQDYNDMGGTFGSALRDRAMILETLVLMNNKEEAFKLVMDIAEELGKDKWMSTQTTAFALKAVGTYIKANKPAEGISCNIKLNGVPKTLKSDMPVMKETLQIDESELNDIEIINTSNSILYVRIVRSGIPELGTETDASNEMQMDIQYTYLDGTPIDIAKIEQGTDFIATVKIKPVGYRNSYENMALTQMFPSGWEILNQRITTVDIGEQSYAEYKDIRDDRVYTYFSTYNNNTRTYRVMLNASFAGKFYLPAVNVAAMYDNTIFARKKGEWVTVESVY